MRCRDRRTGCRQPAERASMSPEDRRRPRPPSGSGIVDVDRPGARPPGVAAVRSFARAASPGEVDRVGTTTGAASIRARSVAGRARSETTWPAFGGGSVRTWADRPCPPRHPAISGGEEGGARPGRPRPRRHAGRPRHPRRRSPAARVLSHDGSSSSGLAVDQASLAAEFNLLRGSPFRSELPRCKRSRRVVQRSALSPRE